MGDFIPEFIALLPNISTQHELLANYNQRAALSKPPVASVSLSRTSVRVNIDESKVDKSAPPPIEQYGIQ